jgi:radical SAM protein with 4Fe4S-binding SPASM domain
MNTTITKVRELQYEELLSYDLISSLKSIEINPVEACTRKCSFCPRSNPKLYPTTHAKISIETCKKIGEDLAEINYTGRVGFVGFGEPLLHNKLEDCIDVVRKNNPNLSFIEVITNGDLLSYSRIQSLYAAGCNLLVISMYDRDISKQIESLRGDIPIQIVYRHHYRSEDNYNLELVNRKEIAFDNTYLNIQSPCYIPFYKLFIDWNGDILTCQNDWNRTLSFGNVNLSSIKDIWTGDLYLNFKKTLAKGSRTIEPCNKCNVCGIKRGEREFNLFNKNFN